MKCEQCGTPTKRSSICRDCRRDRRWHEQRPDILRELYPRRIARKLEQIDIKVDPEDLEAIQAGDQGLYIYGPAGTGKTLYACELMSRMVLPGVDGARTRGFWFATVEGMLEDFRNSYNRSQGEGNPQETATKYKNARYLLLDDLGPENFTDWVYASLYSVINYRYDRLLPTIITSNLNLDEISDSLNDNRIPDRIYEMCRLVPFEGDNKR